jgi:uncharacterized membrane protein YdbT with pleckstrin-like domain
MIQKRSSELNSNVNHVNLDTDVIYKARLHRILFAGPLLLLLISLTIGYALAYRPLQSIAFFFMFFSWVWGAMVWMTYHFSSLTIKKKQLILQSGFLVRQTIDISIARIESIDIRQTVLGTLFQYGSLVIIGTGGTRQEINYLSKPLTCRRYIEQVMHG